MAYLVCCILYFIHITKLPYWFNLSPIGLDLSKLVQIALKLVYTCLNWTL